jgi:DNA invertase Pin-like site-specific DNA recombinase
MIQAAKQKKFQIVLCKSQSRFTRDMELVEKYIHGLFPLWGIRFVAVADNADTEVKGNKKARQINGLVNERYLEDPSENVRMVFDLKRRESKYIDTRKASGTGWRAPTRPSSTGPTSTPPSVPSSCAPGPTAPARPTCCPGW